MKRLTCEMCGSTDLMKESGVFICQTCGCKYSVEEAKKMMIEGTVDVSGSVVKIDTSERLKSLYTLARRAKDDNNISDASKYYNEIRAEDPNSWEAAFYAVYYAALDIRVAQISSAAHSVANCLDSVMELIANYVSKEEQSTAYTEVAVRTLMLGKILMNAAWEAFCDSSRCYDFDRVPNSVHNTLEERRDAAIIAMATAAMRIYQRFDDIYAAKSILDQIEDMCKKANCFSDEYYELCRLNKSFADKIAEIQQKKTDEYWAEHSSEKEALEAERRSLEKQIVSIKAEYKQKIADKKKEIETHSVLAEIANWEARIKALNTHKDSLGIFKGKEKKATQEQIDQASTEKRKLQDKYSHFKRDAENAMKDFERDETAAIAPLQKRIDTINEELTRPR